MQHTDILIIGGGLAGLTGAIHLSRKGFSVTLLEKEAYPHHKVCGEYISNEVLPYLRWLDADPSSLVPAQITHLEFTASSGKKLSSALPLGGFGLSRYTFDHYLYHKALNNGVAIVQDQVTEVLYKDDLFTTTALSGDQYQAKVVIGAFGKRSLLDVKMSRDFIQQKSPWLAVKGHYKGTHPEHIVGLHSFDGGYCGVSRVENKVINICYLVQYHSFKQYKHIEEHQEKVLGKNPVLKAILEQAEPLFSRPITISQVSFERKAAVEHHMLMTGDAAGLIHPLCGNGMAMAIHSAKIAAEMVTRFLHKTIGRAELELSYEQEWNQLFRPRLRIGRQIASLLQHEQLSGWLTRALTFFPAVLPALIRKTHGQPLKIPEYADGYEV